MIYLIPLFGLLRAANGSGKLSDRMMCCGMAAAFAMAQGGGILTNFVITPALYVSLRYAFSYGWSFSAIHGKSTIIDWDMKFSPSGSLLYALSHRIKNEKILGCIGWIPRIFMTFWLPCAIAGNVWAVIPLSLVWGWCYFLGGKINQSNGVRIGEFFTGCLLGWSLI